jgi:hypothetical protein|nr:MAG TPA: hypothetical protein [Caudoviricetes sp.]
MAGMRAKHQKSGEVTYTFSGDLAESIQKARKELRQKEESEERNFLKWQYEKAKKAYETYERRIDDLQGFIRLGTEELERREIEKKEEHNEN